MQMQVIVWVAEHTDFTHFQLMGHWKFTSENAILNVMWWFCLISRGTYLKVNILPLFSMMPRFVTFISW